MLDVVEIIDQSYSCWGAASPGPETGQGVVR